MAKNSFLHPINEVRFGTYTPADVKDALADAIATADAVEKQVLAIPAHERTYQNTVQALNDSLDKLGFVSGIVGHLAGVLGEPWSKQDEFVSAKTAGYLSKRGLNKRVYNTIMTIWDRRIQLELSAAQVRFVEDCKISYERSGIALPSDKKRRLKAINMRLAKLSSLFERNTTEASDKAHIIVKDVADLQGIDTDLVETWGKLAKEKGKLGFYIPYSPPNADAIMRYCDSQKTRIAFHRMTTTRAPKNEKLIYEILALRKEKAQLLGYKNYVDCVVGQRMAKNSKNIKRFNTELYKTFWPYAKKDAAKLRTFIRKKTENPHYELDITDMTGYLPPYYAQKMGNKLSGVDESTIRSYLPLPQVLNTMFGTLTALYGYTFKRSKEPASHKDSEVYHVYDDRERHLATVWCDWYARSGKRSGAWCGMFYEAPRENDRVDEPSLGVVCTNFEPPTNNKPPLLTIRDTETIWHEFGHFIHAVAAKTELREQNGFHSKWDFVEAPSQIMENWVWSDEILVDMAKHYKTGEPLPKDTITKLRASRSFWAAQRVMWTLSWSVVDQMLHTEYDRAKDGSVLSYYRAVRSKFFVPSIPEFDEAICTFSHIFAGGYDSAHYSYQWAEVIEADLFSRFEKEGVLNSKTGRDYRDKVLARGDEVDPDVLVRDFLGRDFTPDALLRRSGIQ